MRTLLMAMVFSWAAFAASAQESARDSNQQSTPEAPRPEAPAEDAEEEVPASTVVVERLEPVRLRYGMGQETDTTKLPVIKQSDYNSYHPWVSHDRQAKPTLKANR
jgi:hypothetical protein